MSDICLPDVCLSVAYIGPKSRTEKPRKTKIGTVVGHVTRDSDTNFKVKGQLAGVGAYCGGLLHSLLDLHRVHLLLAKNCIHIFEFVVRYFQTIAGSFDPGHSVLTVFTVYKSM